MVLALGLTLVAGCPATEQTTADAGANAADAMPGDGAPRDGTARCTTDADGDLHVASACGGDDCDDADPMRYPGRTEVCDPNDHDEDCDPLTFGPRDADGDGFVDAACCNVDSAGARHCGLDCDDSRRTSSPDSPEVCNGVDDDCDGATDEGVQTRYYRDDDVDGHGTAADFADACAPAGAYRSTIADDCDDTDFAIHPGASERCNALDDDCSLGGGADPAEDGDGDLHTASGYAACETGFPRDDCDDTRAAIHPGAAFQTEPWCTSLSPCLSGGAWACGVRSATTSDCDSTVSPSPTPSFDYDCDLAVEVPAASAFCFADCPLSACPPTVAAPSTSHTSADCGLVVPFIECAGGCGACASVSLPDAPLPCR